MAGYFCDGAGVQEDQEQAIAWFQKAYEFHGDAAGDAANGIGLIYSKKGNHVKKFEWYKKSAEEGFDYGMYNVALCYERGSGTNKDLGKAKMWYQKAIDCHGEAEKDARERLNNI